MKYTKSERIAIGELVCTHELTLREAMFKYDIGRTTVQKYVDDYKRHLANPYQEDISKAVPEPKEPPAEMKVVRPKPSVTNEMEEYMAMSKEELIRELIMAKANELRAKKGYEVKGVGANKEFVPLNNKNSKS
jgi:transposase